MRAYLDLMRDALEDGALKDDRTGTGVRSLFGRQLRFDLTNGFPLVTTKRLHLKSIVRELIWFLRGDTNVAYLKAHGVSIWDEWADENGDLGPVYGKQWRAWEGSDGRTIDQIAWVIEEIRRNPDSRRLVVSAWNVAEIERMKLAPCHCLFQFYVANGRLSCQLYQRSADIFLGVPFNIASYALLTHLVARECGLEVGEFVHYVRRRPPLSQSREPSARAARARAAARCRASSSARSARSSISTPTRSRSRAMTRGRRSGPRLQCERSAAGPGRGGCAQWRHRLGPGTPLAAFERPETVQGADLGQTPGDGTEDLSHDWPSAVRARDNRRHPRSRFRRPGRPRRP